MLKKIFLWTGLLSLIVLISITCISLGDMGKRSDPTPGSPLPGQDAPPAGAVTKRFSDGFEGAAAWNDLFPRDYSRWHGSQRTPKENVVELTHEKVHSGKSAMKFFAKARRGGSVPKADIERSLLQFKKGDHVWFSGWYFIVGGTDARDVFLWDLEDSTTYQNPGRRVYIQEGEYLASDLGKTLFGQTFRQGAKKFPVIKDRWFQIKIHLFLSEGSDGRMEVWQDGVKVIDGKGRTLPSASSVYDRLQIGLTANASDKYDHTVYVDDISIADSEGDL